MSLRRAKSAALVQGLVFTGALLSPLLAASAAHADTCGGGPGNPVAVCAFPRPSCNVGFRTTASGGQFICTAVDSAIGNTKQGARETVTASVVGLGFDVESGESSDTGNGGVENESTPMTFEMGTGLVDGEHVMIAVTVTETQDSGGLPVVLGQAVSVTPAVCHIDTAAQVGYCA